MDFAIFMALFLGFVHAFEADHVVAVSNMVTRRDRLSLAIKDGAFWGLGHSSTILIIGILMLVGKHQISEQVFTYFEAVVGLMLIILGLYRLRQLKEEGQHIHFDEGKHHGTAYGIGVVHGLAGSGALLALIMSQLDTVGASIVYLLLFGAGSVIGMLVAAGVFSLPFSKEKLAKPAVQVGLILVSSGVCLILGGKLLYENLIY